MTWSTCKERVDRAMEIPGAYDPKELEALDRYVGGLSEGGVVVEIGCMYGRSTSIYAQHMKELKLNVIVVDNFCVNGSDAWDKFQELMEEYPDILLLKAPSETVDNLVPDMDFLHIDGNHMPEGIRFDCMLYLPKLRKGGVAAFHDYNTVDVDGERLIFPAIKETVDEYTKGWEDLGIIGRLALRRKPWTV